MAKRKADIGYLGSAKSPLARAASFLESTAATVLPDGDKADGLTPKIGICERRPPASLRRWGKTFLGLTISAVFVVIVFHGFSLQDVGSALVRADRRMISLGIASLAVGYALRVTRWWLMLRVRTLGLLWTQAAGPFLISVAANNVLPLRAGDILRLFAFRSRPGLEPSRIAGTLVIERLLDLTVLLLIFAIVLTQVVASGALEQMARLGQWVAVIGVLVAVAVFSLPIADRLLFSFLRQSSRVRGKPWVGKLLQLEAVLADTIAGLGSPAILIVLAALSIVIWLFEGGVFVAALAAFDTSHATVIAAFFALAVATLATLVPSSPGYVGTFHFFAIQALLPFQIAPTTAAAVAISAHLMLWLPTTSAGLLALCWKVVGPSNQTSSVPR